MAGDFQTKELSGSMFINDKKTQPNQPDYNGSCKINDVEYWVAGWVKVSARNTKYLSLAFSHKDESKKPAVQAASSFLDDVKTDPKKAEHLASRPTDDFEDDIPFSDGVV